MYWKENWILRKNIKKYWICLGILSVRKSQTYLFFYGEASHSFPKSIALIWDFNAQFVFVFNIQGGHNTINTRQNKLKLLMLYWTFAVLSGILSPLSCNQWHKYCSYSCKEIWASPQGEEWLLKSTCPHWNQLVHTCEGMKLSNVNNNDWQVAEICLKKIIFCSSFILDTKIDTKYIPKIITNLCGRVVGYWEGVAYLTFPTREGLYIPCDLSHDACYVSTPPPRQNDLKPVKTLPSRNCCCGR